MLTSRDNSTYSRRVAPLLLLIAVAMLTSGQVKAQEAKAAAPDPLFVTVSALDTALFNAYNQCDLKKLGSMVSDDLEFYHDRTGLAVGKQIFLESIQKNICGKVTRELVPGSLEVYPLNGYGAVEFGSHRFHHPGEDATEPVGEAKFVTIWQNKDGVWKVTRVISYDHGSVAK
jgi:Domain of unknown function (DUF4440)